MIDTIYVDLDGTLVGPGGNICFDGTSRTVDALLRAQQGGITIVPISGRGRLQMREFRRLFGFSRAIGELGGVVLDGTEVRYQLGAYPADNSRSPVQQLEQCGALDGLRAAGLEDHDPWNEGREVSWLMRGDIESGVAEGVLHAAGCDWAHVTNNGTLSGGRGHVFHVGPRGVSKQAGVARDRDAHGLRRESAAFVGDSPADLACASEVAPGWCFLVANAAPSLEWAPRTSSAYGLGVAEVIDAALAQR